MECVVHIGLFFGSQGPIQHLIALKMMLTCQLRSAQARQHGKLHQEAQARRE